MTGARQQPRTPARTGRRSVVVLGPGGSHLGRLLPIIAALGRRGLAVHVMTRGSERERVAAAGGRFIDVFGRHPVEAVDDRSRPLPSRLVTFAAAYAEPLVAEVAALRPALLVYDAFFVPAPLIGRRLGVPYVGVRSGHGQVPGRAIAAARADPGVCTSAACLAAVASLAADHGMADASPFSYLDGVSPHLNLYPEPEPFLDDDVRAALQPVACFGSLAPDLSDALGGGRPLAAGAGAPRVLVAFGSVVWRYHARAALETIARLTAILSARGADTLVGLGGHALDPAGRARLARPNVRIEGSVDQWGALKDADLFVTHHGLSSTHEAIYHRVPMVSCPFLGDQPALAARCRELGLALPIGDAPAEPPDVERAGAAIESLLARRNDVAESLALARGWELQVIAGREAVIDRMLSLAGLR